MSDLIERQDVIKFIYYLLSQPCEGHTGDFVEGMRDGYYRIRSAIKYLPSAQKDDRVNKIAELVDGTIDHFDRDDAMDLLYQIKEVLK